jgi:hypothetical protein
MNASRYARFFVGAAIAAAAVTVPAVADAQFGRADRGAQRSSRETGAAYERGYQEGLRRGEQDSRQGRRYDVDRDNAYRDNRGRGNAANVQDSFRRGYTEGYRVGYERIRSRGRYDRGGRRGLGYGRDFSSDPAQARGYSDGYEKGFDDGEDRDRFDPLREGDYRDGDNGYQREYGSKELYRNNYRAGFSRGYEDGYRDGNRRGR